MKLLLLSVLLIAAAIGHVSSQCTSTKNPALAQRLSKEIPAALKGRSGQHAVSMYDRVSDTTCHFNAARQFATASIIKSAILSAAMRKCQLEKKQLTEPQKQQAHRMITVSDNNAAAALWNWVGVPAMKQFYGLVGMPKTNSANGKWGSSVTTSGDQLNLLKMLTHPNQILTDPSRGYVLDLMSKTVPAQRWGTPVGAPAGTRVHVKNGWFTPGGPWQVNSIGAFARPGKDYMIVVLTNGQPNEKYGHQTIEGVAKVIHKAV